jgi:hypothetical protein
MPKDGDNAACPICHLWIRPWDGGWDDSPVPWFGQRAHALCTLKRPFAEWCQNYVRLMGAYEFPCMCAECRKPICMPEVLRRQHGTSLHAWCAGKSIREYNRQFPPKTPGLVLHWRRVCAFRVSGAVRRKELALERQYEANRGHVNETLGLLETLAHS